MDDSANIDALVEHFGKLTPDIAAELLSMLRLYKIDDQELFFKWESYSIKMGEQTKLDLDTVRAFKRDVQEQLEKSERAKVKLRETGASKVAQRTPRHVKSSGDSFALLVPTTPGSVKRKLGETYGTPSKSSRLHNVNSPGEAALGSSPIRAPYKNIDSVVLPPTPFSKRTNAGDTVEILNGHIPIPTLPLPESSLSADRAAWENRVKLVSRGDIKKFSYRPMHQKLSEASEVLDDRIDDFMAAVQEHYQFADEEFGNPSTASPSEIIAVGRIASDSVDGALNEASVVLESSRKMGAGSRVPLRLNAVKSYSFFSGQLVAVRGVNASGDYFAVNEVLEVPALPIASSSIRVLADVASQLSAGPLSIIIASGPYTTDDNLLFESLDEICRRAAETCPDVLILTGPFIDSEHPLIKTGDFDLEGPDANEGTLEDLFREKITRKIKMVERSIVLLIPSVRDIVSKHVAYPQDKLDRKTLGLPSNVKCLTNPAIFSINEIVFGISTSDILFHLSREEIRLAPREPIPLTRLSKHIITQHNFYPLFPPPTGAQLPGGMGGVNLDVPYLRLLDFVNVTPDVIVLPSRLANSVRVVDGVVVMNPGMVSKKAGPGTYARVVVEAPKVQGVGEEEVGHKVYERARVEIVRI